MPSIARGEVEIIGVVKDIRLGNARDVTPPTAYLSDQQGNQRTRGNMGFIVRVAGDPLLAIPAIREAVREADPDLPLSDIKTQVQQISESFALERTLTIASNFFAVIALLLVSIGMYGVMSYAVARRTSEIGIRMALGAQPSAVAWGVQREILIIVGTGALIGVGGSLASAGLIRSVLFGVAPAEPWTMFCAVLSMIVVSILAGYLPARRAAGVDPMVALRNE
jgi:ABC-type antimicrobial peptide transport system permease subunit